jgi:Fe-S cluster assembly protein SufD
MATAVATTGISQASFDAFVTARDEPQWLLDMRRRSWAGVDLGGRAVAMNSHAVRAELSSELSKQGVLFGSLGRLVKEHGDLLRPYFERQVVDPHKDKFAALNAACWSGGTLLYVPKHVRLEQPLHSLSAISDGGVDFGKTLVILEPGADATLLMETASAVADGSGMHCGSIELIVEQGARLRYVNLQNWGHEVWHFAHQKGVIAREGRLQWTIGALGSRLAKVNQHVAMTGPDAEVQVNGVMFTEGRQHLSYNTHQHHQAPYCKSDLLYKTALQDRSRTVWRGMIRVDRDAQRTDAYQRNDNLMLSRDARADSIPGLEIEADDVRCTHGSTSGRVDEQQMFYAMTRGYTRREAVRMIVTGFFQQVFDRITIESVRDALGEAIGRRVRDIKEAGAA